MQGDRGSAADRQARGHERWDAGVLEAHVMEQVPQSSETDRVSMEMQCGLREGLVGRQLCRNCFKYA